MNYIKKIFKKIIPVSFLEKLNTEIYSIDKFVKFSSNEIPANALVLDAGAGSCPYKKYFNNHHYESTDFENIFEIEHKNKHSFICSLDNIPKSDNYYDAIINTQVLEHVENPQLVLNEMYRILKPGGKLFLTAPQGWGVHGAPYHFFNFTNYGLELLLKKSGFNIILLNQGVEFFGI